MAYKVKELYYTLQGEGAQAGRPAVFCRFTGCNLWSGREADRAQAVCWFCDTDFVGTDGPGGGSFATAAALAAAIESLWPVTGEGTGRATPCVVFTGGEPLLQLDTPLLLEMRRRGFSTAVETNGTVEAPAELDWITVSPKVLERLRQTKGQELKLIFPGAIPPEAVAHLDFTYFFLSPCTTSDEVETRRNLEAAIQFCKANPQWRLTYQYHKLWRIP